MNTQQEYEYFDGKGQICQGNEEYFDESYKKWMSSGFKSGEILSKTHKYRRSINYFTKEYQAELARQWVLEGGFEREYYEEMFGIKKWVPASCNNWNLSGFYRRKPQPTQEELDDQAAKEYSKTATIQTDTTVIEKAYIEGMKHERNRNK